MSLYSCKQIRSIAKNRLRSMPKSELLQDQDYFDLVKKGIKRLHRVLTGLNYNHYKKIQASYIIHSQASDIVAFPADLYKVIGWKMNPTHSLGDGVLSGSLWKESVHWCEIDNGSNRGFIQLEKRKESGSTQDIEGSLTYIREPDMPSNWASTPDIPDGYDDWLVQYVITEGLMYMSLSPQLDFAKLKELDEIVISMNRRGGAAGQTAAS